MSNDEIKATVEPINPTVWAVKLTGLIMSRDFFKEDAQAKADHINRVLRLVELRGQIAAIERGCLPSCLVAMNNELNAMEKELGL